ncbi:MAG: TRAP transporter substrate-binding protein DctP [Hyphomicrobiaceae bacterium]
MRVIFLAFAILIAAFGDAALAEKRLALVIGNKSYRPAVGALSNPHNDIEIVGAALASLGFSVTMARDVDRLGLYLAIDRHVKAMASAGEGAVGFFYYSGHGSADAERAADFLIPVDVADTAAETLHHASVPLKYIFTELARKAPGTRNFIAFDACRDSLAPAGKSLMKGFIGAAAPPGADMVVAFASAAGAAASDDGTRGGPYSNALAREIVRPLYHLDIFQNIREAVFRATGGKQKPWELNGMAHRVCLHPSCPAVVPSAATVDTSAAVAKVEAERRAAAIRADRLRLPVVEWRSQAMLPANAGAGHQDGVEADPHAAISAALKVRSDGRLSLAALPVGAVVPSARLPEAVSKGVLDAALIWPGALGRQDSAFEPLGGAALDSIAPERYVTWLRADGRRLLGDLYRQAGFDLISMPCGLLAAGGYFYKRRLEQVADIRGVKVRTSSPLSRKVTASLGAQPTSLVAAEQFTALQRGMIDATESFDVDQTLRLGFHEVASNYYQFDPNAVRMLDLVINAKSWNRLDPLLRVVVQSTCDRRLDEAVARIGRRNAALARDLAARGVKVHELPGVLKASYGEASTRVLAGEAERSAAFRKVIDSYQLFRD